MLTHIESSPRLRFISRLSAVVKWIPSRMLKARLAIRYNGDVYPAKYGENYHEAIARRIGIEPFDDNSYGGFERGYIDE